MKTKFIIADEIRPEVSGKQTILGLFADDVIVVHAPPLSAGIPHDTPPGIERIAFLINVSGLTEGSHSIKGELFAPTGAAYGVNLPLDEFKVDTGNSHSIVIEMKPFILKGFGTYNWSIWIDEEELKCPFEVRTGNKDS